MSGAPAECSVFRTEDLLPETWRAAAGNGPVRAFNPGFLRDRDGWLFAYRVVAPDGLRRIGLCRLDAKLRPIAGSPLPFTDQVRFRTSVDYPDVARQWFADPRLYRLGERIFIYWNSGWHEPRNYQFVQELDPVTLLPRGVARELLLRGERQKLEKNWTFFQTGRERKDEFHAVYAIAPHRVLAFSIEGEGDITFEEVSRTEWSLPSYPPSHGGLRGGAPPVLADGRFWSFCHSVHDGANGYRYLPAAYCFEAEAPFRPSAAPVRPLSFGAEFEGKRAFPRLNPAVDLVVYPCGAARDGTRWLISHGINDELCAISRVEQAEVSASLQALPSG